MEFIFFFSSVDLKALGELRQLSVVVVCCMMSTLSKDISSEATGPFKPKFHLWHLWTGGWKKCVFLMKIGSLVWLTYNGEN